MWRDDMSPTGSGAPTRLVNGFVLERATAESSAAGCGAGRDRMTRGQSEPVGKPLEGRIPNRGLGSDESGLLSSLCPSSAGCQHGGRKCSAQNNARASGHKDLPGQTDEKNRSVATTSRVLASAQEEALVSM